jgi:hypothetical protein
LQFVLLSRYLGDRKLLDCLNITGYFRYALMSSQPYVRTTQRA